MRTLLLCSVFVLAAVAPAQAQFSMYADPKANQPGDLLTIVLVERTSAQRESDWNNQSNAAVGAASAVAADGLTGQFGADARFNKEARVSNASLQRDLLTGTITALVTGVDSTSGNLIVTGERRLSVNGESHLLKVSGLVRPYDVRDNNTILSYQIANADIEYHRGGFHRRFFKPGAFVRIGLAAVLGAAVVFAAQ